MSAPPSSAPSSTTEFVPLRSSSSSSSSCTRTYSSTEPGQPNASSSSQSSVPWSQTICTWSKKTEEKIKTPLHKISVSGLTECASMHPYLLEVVWKEEVHVQNCFGLRGVHCRSLCERQLELVHSRKNHGPLLCERRYLQKAIRDLVPSAGQPKLCFQYIQLRRSNIFISKWSVIVATYLRVKHL